MKMKNIFVTLAGLALLGGASVGLANGQKTMKAAKATIGEIGLYVDLGWSDIQQVKAAIGSAQYSDMSTVTSGYGNYYISVASNVTLNSISFYFRQYDNNYWHPYIDDSWDSDNNTISGTFVPGHDYQITSISWVHEETYANKWFSYTLNDLTNSHIVTKYEVVNGVLNETPIDSEYNDGSVNYNPARRNKSGHHFAGWFTDAACTISYVERKITADTNLYAKYVSFSKDSYIYYITDSSSATPNMIHTWGGDVEYTNNDVLITGISGVQEVHGVVRFRNTDYLIYKIPFSSESGDTGFNFHYNNWQTKSDNKTLVAGNAYQWGVGGIETDETAGGDALDFIFQLEAIRNAVSAAGDIKAYSVCGISKANAQTLVSAYTGLSATAKGYVDASYTYTYKRTDSSQNDNVTFADIMVEITAIANKPDGSHSMDITNTNNALMIVVVSVISLVALSSFVLLRKKRNSK